MGRPRLHDEDAILDAAELLAAEGEEVTVRALSERTGASTGTLYHSFGSRSELLGRMWARAAGLYMRAMEERVDAALAPDGPGSADAAVIAAATTTAEIRREEPAKARLLAAHRRDELLGEGVAAEVAEQLVALDQRLIFLLKRLARERWGRAGRRNVDLVVACVVDIPGAILAAERPERRDPEALIEAAVRGVLAEG